MAKYNRFSDRADALAFLHHVNDNEGFPIVGNVNGVPAPQNQQTERWAEGPIDCEDDKSAVKHVPESFYLKLGLDATGISGIQSTYLTSVGATLEDYDPAWEPDEESSFTEILATGTVTAKSEQGVNVAINVVDRNPGTFWRGNADPQWLKVEFPSAQTVTHFRLKARGGTANEPLAIGFPRRFEIQGSNNDSDWTTLRLFANERFAPREDLRFRIPLANRAAYTFYRIRFITTEPSSNISIAEWRMFVSN